VGQCREWQRRGAPTQTPRKKITLASLTIAGLKPSLSLGYYGASIGAKHVGYALMRLSTKGRYAVTAMLDLALNAGQGPVTLSDISENQGISLSYLEQLFAALRSKNLVRGVRGPGGGYYLGKDPDEISIADIICAVDEWVEFTRCGGRQNCRNGQKCLTHSLWDHLSDEIFGFLSQISLRDVVERGGHREAKIAGRIGVSPDMLKSDMLNPDVINKRAA
jgi:Rrf2 family iron-sulfur cluster assembly transcriptional regulator